MRRKDREIIGNDNISQILEQCTTCHVAMIDSSETEPAPYVVPLSYGYSLANGILELWFHCANFGKKLDCLRANPKVSFSICVEKSIEIHEENYCRSGRYYASVCGNGTAQIIQDSNEKCKALSLIMKRHASAVAPQGSPLPPYEFSAEHAQGVTIFKITSTNFTGKARG